MSARYNWLSILMAAILTLIGSLGCNSDDITPASASAFTSASGSGATGNSPNEPTSTNPTTGGEGSGTTGSAETSLGTTGSPATSSSSGEGCHEGTEGCPCLDDLCFPGLECLNGTCSSVDETTTGGGTTGEMTGTTGEPWEPCSLITCYDIFAEVDLMGEEPCFVYKGMALKDQQAVNALVWWAEKFGYTHAFDPSLDPIGSQLYNFTFLTDQERWAVEFLEFRGIDLTHLSGDFTGYACMEKILPLRDEIWGAKPYWTVLDPAYPSGIHYNEGYGQVLKLGFASYPGVAVPLQELTVLLDIINGNNPAMDCKLYITFPGDQPKPVTAQGLLPGKNALWGFQVELEGYVELELHCDPSMEAYPSNFKVWPADDGIAAELRVHGKLTEPVNIMVFGG